MPGTSRTTRRFDPRLRAALETGRLELARTAASAAEAPERRIWIDGALVPWSEATVHVLADEYDFRQSGGIAASAVTDGSIPAAAAARELLQLFLGRPPEDAA